MRIVILIIGLTAACTSANAQQKWNLRTIVDYAMANNITVRLTDVQTRQAELTYKQSKMSRWPSLIFSTNGALNNGSYQSPTDFSRVTQTSFTSSTQLQSSADIFNFYSKRNTIAANEWEVEAAKANVDKVKNDIALTAANAYLQILLSVEQQKITVVQIQQTQAQLTNTLKLVKAGSLPELNATQLEAQLALDSVNYITAKGAVTQNILTLKSYMNIDAAADFQVDTPPVESIPLESLADLVPEMVYAMALQNMPLQRYNELKLKAAEKNIAANKGAMYPTLSAFGNLGTNYLDSRTPGVVISGYQNSAAVVNVGGTNYPVLTPEFVKGGPDVRSAAFGTQLNDNFRQTIGLNLSVPIFSGGTLRANYQRSKLNRESLLIQKEQDNQKLKQDIFSAYNSVLIALEKFNASAKSVAMNEKTFGYAQKRFDVGMLNTYDLITTQNNLLRAKLEYTLNQFDYVFKMKVLEFYKGLGLKL
ncbi:TolC family protein [Ferruginibacter sp. HRS2-29]|uniref:TolC family protein n=1 Tax=Ferruginibacter sp. HRS2-29 TaxID=2487334 RepID=UPI0020CD1A9F|nr:TolC family protein [Ferruginibacter sp. HRS2-29]MCP9749969.1 TolC family protein [Ferruginibacter sp. HRS2-29]